MEAYSKEFRRDVLRACDAGGGTREVALKFDVSESWVRRIKQERREQGKAGSQDDAHAAQGLGAACRLDPGEAGPPAGHLSARVAGGRAGRARLAGLRRHAQPGLPRAAPHAKKKTLIAAEQDRRRRRRGAAAVGG